MCCTWVRLRLSVSRYPCNYEVGRRQVILSEGKTYCVLVVSWKGLFGVPGLKLRLRMNRRSKDWNDSKDPAKGKVSMFICLSPHAMQAADLVGTTHPTTRRRPIPIRHNPNSRHRTCFFPADRAFARWAAPPPRYSDGLLLEDIAVWTSAREMTISQL